MTAPALALMLALGASPATDRLLAADGIVVAEASSLPRGLDDAAWHKAPLTLVAVAPQRTVTFNDKDANAARDQRSPRTIAVRALASATELALLCEWQDATEERIDDSATDAFADGVAIELPLLPVSERLPYVGMGDDGAPVLVHFARAGKKDVVLRSAVAAGFGSLTRADVGWVRASMRYDAGNKRWRAMFTRPLTPAEHRLDGAIVPIAFAVWDGARDQRGGNKLLSAWRLLRLPRRAPDERMLEALAFGYRDGDLGDATRGKAFVSGVCAACHRFGDKQTAPLDLAPDLSYIGVIASYGYLRDSLLAPGVVVVPAAHGVRSAPMPPFPLSPQQLGDVLAYLKTLGAEP